MLNKKNSPRVMAIDGNEANVTNRVGSNVYAYEIILELEKLSQKYPDWKVEVLLSTPPVADLPPVREGWNYRVIKPRFLWTQFALPLFLFFRAGYYAVLFTPGHYAPRLSSVPYVSSVMDLAFLHFPEQFRSADLLQLKEWTAYSVKHARKVIAISQATKQDVIRSYGRTANEVVVAYPSISQIESVATASQLRRFMTEYRIRSPYILYVGTFQPRKNLLRLIEAFEKLHYQWPPLSWQRRGLGRVRPQLVLVGKIGWMAEEVLNRITTSPMKKYIITPGYVSDEIKYGLYQQASCSALVGLYEGFGIPPLESLAVGTVPVVSNTSSLPEVVGPAGKLVDPYQAESIAEGLLEACTLTSRQRLTWQRLCKNQVKKFSWARSAQIIWQTVTSAAKPK